MVNLPFARRLGWGGVRFLRSSNWHSEMPLQCMPPVDLRSHLNVLPTSFYIRNEIRGSKSCRSLTGSVSVAGWQASNIRSDWLGSDLVDVRRPPANDVKSPRGPQRQLTERGDGPSPWRRGISVLPSIVSVDQVVLFIYRVFDIGVQH
jgi:hypothetical protein